MSAVECVRCHVQTTSNARCSACKTVRYCSKECQRQHWTESHRLQCQILGKIVRFAHLESKWWSTRSLKEINEWILTKGLKPESMMFYGEVLLLLIGQKACVLFSNLPSQWRHDYITSVLISSGIFNPIKLSSNSASTGSSALYFIPQHLETQVSFEMSGDLVLVNRDHHFASIAIETLHLKEIDTSSIASVHIQPLSDQTDVVGEQTLAQILDYPISLETCHKPLMIEIGYFGTFPWQPNQNPVLLTSYCADTTVQSTMKVGAHFKRYQRALDGICVLKKCMSQL